MGFPPLNPSFSFRWVSQLSITAAASGSIPTRRDFLPLPCRTLIEFEKMRFACVRPDSALFTSKKSNKSHTL